MDTSKKEFKDVGSFKSNALLFLVCFSGIVVIILASNLEIFCFPKYNRAFGISNEELFFIYSAIFTIINVFLLKYSRSLEPSIFKIRTILFVIILVNQLLLASILFMIYGQIKIISQYNNALFYTIIYASLISSALFLAISGIQFLRWFTRGRNYLVLIYGLVMLVLFANSIIGAIYLSQVSVTHGQSIKRTSCSVMMGSLTVTRPGSVNTLANAYDITSFLSFVLAWIATISMLKEYSKRINKFVFWVVVILPLVFFISRYELALYYFVNDQGVDVLASINLSSDIYGYKTLENILNLNLQLGGAFFGIAFFTIASKLTGRGQQRKALILTGIGIMFLFASKDISTLIISSYPPLGAVSIAFVGLASYMVYLGIYSAASLTARDKNLRRDLRQKVENNVMLLKSIATSQDELDIEKNVKHVMNLSTQWQEENRQLDMTPEEIREIAKDVILMVKTSKKS
ncbi:MAG: hypothetical protein ACHQ1D_05545 [Nitrososphaerales archaeon]